MTHEWGPGAIIMGRYRLESLLGRGGMGSVWRAEHLGLKSPVAIKMLDPAIAGDEQMLARFMREAQSAASLRSPNVVQIFDHGLDDGKAFIAMELLTGEPLSERIARTGGMPSEEALRFMTEVLRAIHKAHEAGIVHRDLKPDNIFIVKDEPEFVKVLDFGVAKVQKGELGGSAASKTQTGMMIGTPYYMSPEQTQAKDVDHRADLWAIAVIAFEALTGRRPFTGDSFGELVIAICTGVVPVPSKVTPVPRGFDEWFVRGTQRDRTRRFQSAREMADELVRIATGTTGPQRAVTSLAPLRTGPITASVSVSATPPPGGAVAPVPDQLELTTGQRSAVSRGESARPGSAASPALLALLAMAGLIVLGVGYFVVSGGARGFKAREEPAQAAAAEPAPGPAVRTAPIVPEPVAAVPPRSEPVVLPAGASSAGDAAPKPLPSASTKPKAPPARAQTPARSAASAAPARATSKDPLPPKHWEF